MVDFLAAADRGRAPVYDPRQRGRAVSVNTPCYVGVKACGCWVAVTVDIADEKERTAKFVAQMIHDGLTVLHTTSDEVRSRFRRCVHEPQQTSLPT